MDPRLEPAGWRLGIVGAKSVAQRPGRRGRSWSDRLRRLRRLARGLVDSDRSPGAGRCHERGARHRVRGGGRAARAGAGHAAVLPIPEARSRRADLAAARRVHGRPRAAAFALGDDYGSDGGSAGLHLYLGEGRSLRADGMAQPVPGRDGRPGGSPRGGRLKASTSTRACCSRPWRPAGSGSWRARRRRSTACRRRSPARSCTSPGGAFTIRASPSRG